MEQLHFIGCLTKVGVEPTKGFEVNKGRPIPVGKVRLPPNPVAVRLGDFLHCVETSHKSRRSATTYEYTLVGTVPTSCVPIDWYAAKDLLSFTMIFADGREVIARSLEELYAIDTSSFFGEGFEGWANELNCSISRVISVVWHSKEKKKKETLLKQIKDYAPIFKEKVQTAISSLSSLSFEERRKIAVEASSESDADADADLLWQTDRKSLDGNSKGIESQLKFCQSVTHEELLKQGISRILKQRFSQRFSLHKINFDFGCDPLVFLGVTPKYSQMIFDSIIIEAVPEFVTYKNEVSGGYTSPDERFSIGAHTEWVTVENKRVNVAGTMCRITLNRVTETTLESVDIKDCEDADEGSRILNFLLEDSKLLSESKTRKEVSILSDSWSDDFELKLKPYLEQGEGNYEIPNGLINARMITV